MEDSKPEFQFYLIGVYGFVGLLIAGTIITLLGKMTCKACCHSKETHRRRHRAPASSANSDESLGNVNVDDLDEDRNPSGNNSDYDYYSDEESTSQQDRDRPPDYEHPPTYEKSVEV